LGAPAVKLDDTVHHSISYFVEFAETHIRALKPYDEGGIVLSEQAKRLMQIQEAAFDALDKGYLARMVLGIYSDDKDPAACRLLESYACEWTSNVQLLLLPRACSHRDFPTTAILLGFFLHGTVSDKFSYPADLSGEVNAVIESREQAIDVNLVRGQASAMVRSLVSLCGSFFAPLPNEVQ
jgi:hypothetical protein